MGNSVSVRHPDSGYALAIESGVFFVKYLFKYLWFIQ